MNISQFDSSRMTAGALYRDAQIHGEKQIVVGDMNYEIRKSLVDDLNEAIQIGTIDFEGSPFYIRVYERWDLQMKKALVRSLFKMIYRPYPEHESSVYRVVPHANDVYFCWQLPHRHEMMNELNCPDLFDPKQLALYRQWENMRLEHFGFMKNDEGNWIENPMYKGDILISHYPDRNVTVAVS